MKKDPAATKRKIKESFITLYQQRRIDAISIGEITKNANVYRGTFYYYYKDIYDLLEQIEKEILDIAAEIVPKLIQAVLIEKIQNIEPIFNKILEEHKAVLKLFLVEKPNPQVIKKLKQCAKTAALKKLGFLQTELPEEALYLMEYMASAQISLFTICLENEKNMDFTKFTHTVISANLRGPLTCLKEFIRQ